MRMEEGKIEQSRLRDKRNENGEKLREKQKVAQRDTQRGKE